MPPRTDNEAMRAQLPAARPSAIVFYGGFRFRGGGAFKHAEALDKQLRERGWNVRLVSLDDLPTPAKYLPHLVEKLVNLWAMPLGFYSKGRVTRMLYRLMPGLKADLYVFEDIYLAWNSEVRSISILHAVWSDNLQAFDVASGRVQRLVRKEARVLDAIDHPVVTVSVPYREYLNKHLGATAFRKRIDVIELGLDIAVFPRATSEWNPHSLVYCGALEARKNVRFMLEVFRLVASADPESTLTIIGNGPDQASLEQYAADHGLPVDFKGRCSHDVVLSELRRHSIYLHTSTKESFSFSLLEAKLCGLTTFALAGLEVPEEFIDEPMASFDPDEWARRILSIRSPAPARDLSRFTAARMTERTLHAAGFAAVPSPKPDPAASPLSGTQAAS